MSAKIGTEGYAIDKQQRYRKIKAACKDQSRTKLKEALLSAPFLSVKIDAPLDEYGNTAIHKAAENRDYSFLLYLLGKGASPFVANYSGFTIFDYCDVDSELKQILDIFCRGESAYKSVWQKVTISLRSYREAMVADAFDSLKRAVKYNDAILLDRTLNPQLLQKTDPEGLSCLHWACYHGNLDIVRKLLEEGARIDQTSEIGVFPLLLATFSGHEEVVNYLIEKKSDLNINSKRVSALKMASWRGLPRIVYSLLKNGAKYINGENWLRSDLEIGNMQKGRSFSEKKEFLTVKELLQSFDPQLDVSIPEDIKSFYDDKQQDYDFKRNEALEFNCLRKIGCAEYINSKKVHTELQAAWLAKYRMDPDSKYYNRINSIISKLPLDATWLECIFFNMGSFICELVLAVSQEEKNQYIPLLAKVSSKCDEIVYKIEDFFDSKASRLLFSESKEVSVRKLIQDIKLCSELFVKHARLSTGVWPPENASSNMLETAFTLHDLVRRLILIGVSIGFAERGRVILNHKSSVGPRTLDYHEYKLQQTATVFDRNVSSVSTLNLNDSSELETVTVHRKFTNRLQSITTDFVTAVSKLNNSRIKNMKEVIVHDSSLVSSKIEILTHFILNSEVFQMDSSAILDGKDSLKNLREELKDLTFTCQNVIKWATLHSGVWPPENSSAMLSSSLKLLVQKFKSIAKNSSETVTRISSVLESQSIQRRQWQRLILTSKKTQDLFKKWENVQKAGLENIEIDIDRSIFDPRQRSDLIIETTEKGMVVKGGSLNSLMDFLIYQHDTEFISAFILMHHSFAESIDCLQLMIQKYDNMPPFGLNQLEFEKYVQTKIIPARLRICNILKIWVTKYFDDFERDPELLKFLREFISEKLINDFSNISSNLSKLIFDNLEHIQATVVLTKADAPEPIFTSQTNELNDESIHLVSPIEVARQLSLQAYGMYRKIHCKEFLNQAWTTADKHILAPNITKMIQITNETTMWVASTILTKKTQKDQLANLKFMISVAKECHNLGNFNCVTSIIAGLQMGPIRRMQALWKYSELYDTFEILCELSSPKGQYASYRKELHNTNPPLIPFIGVYLTDLTFIEDGNPDIIPNSTLVNFEKRRKFAVVIREMQQYQNLRYSFIEVAQIQTYFQNLKSLPENELYALSLVYEPRKE